MNLFRKTNPIWFFQKKINALQNVCLMTRLIIDNFFVTLLKAINRNYAESRSSVAKCFNWKKHSSEVFCKKDIVKTSQNSQENTCVGVLKRFNKLQALLKERLWHKFFPVNKNYFEKHLRTTNSTEFDFIS